MAQEPKTVFLLSADGFKEISYTEFSENYKTDRAYMETHFFARFGAYLMEVSQTEYARHYRLKRRQKYLDELAAANKTVSYDALATAEFSGQDTLIDLSVDVADEVIQKLLLDKLGTVILQLSKDEQTLIHEIFFHGLSERALTEKYGISQVAIHKRKVKILDKLKKMIKT